MNDNLSNDLEEQEPNPSFSNADNLPADDDLPEAVVPFGHDGGLDGVILDDDYILDAPNALDFTFSASGLEDLDIEGALASLTGLDAALAEHASSEAEEQPAVEPEPALDPEQVRRETESRRKALQTVSTQIQQPSFGRLGRGQLASVIPAVLLMIFGAGLTVYLAEPSVFEGTPIHAGLIVPLLIGMVGITLISYWLSSGRWASGALFVGASVLSCLGVLAFVETGGFPLLLSAIGLSASISALLSRGTTQNQTFIGLALFIGGLAGYGFNLNIGQFDLTRLQPVLLGAVGIVLVLLLIAPLFAKKQR